MRHSNYVGRGAAGVHMAVEGQEDERAKPLGAAGLRGSIQSGQCALPSTLWSSLPGTGQWAAVGGPRRSCAGLCRHVQACAEPRRLSVIPQYHPVTRYLR